MAAEHATPPNPSLFRPPPTPGGRRSESAAAPPGRGRDVPPGGTDRTHPGLTPAARPTRRLFFHGSGLTFLGLQLTNALLTLVSLGLYWFWAKVRVRQYLLSQSELEGDRFAYHGTGGELLVGFLKVFGVLILPVSVLIAAFPVVVDPALGQALALVAAAAWSLVGVPLAMVGARRYRLSRTSWRNVRFSFRGGTGPFIRLFAAGSLLTLVTLGLYYPFFEARRQTFLVSHAWFGSRRFGFTGRGRDLFGPFLGALLLTLPTLGLSWVWFAARKRRFVWDHTSFDGARFRCRVTGGALLGLWVVNALLIVLTLGLARSWVTVRNVRFAFAYLTLEGMVDFEAIRQEAQEASATGEGLAGFFDTGGFDLG